MSATTNTSQKPETHGRRRTLIGSGTRVEGSITFSGTLHVRGEVIGDVAASTDSGNDLLVDDQGRVAGVVKAERVVVRGRLETPNLAADSIEIHAGGSSVGTTSYRDLTVHYGGFIDGLLQPAEADRVEERPAAAPKTEAAPEAEAEAEAAPGLPPAAPAPDASGPEPSPPAAVAESLQSDRQFGGAWRKPTIAALALAIAASTLWLAREPATPPAVPVEQASAPAPKTEAIAAPPEVASTTASVSRPANPPPPPAADRQRDAATEHPEPPAGRAVTIKGINPERPADRLYLVTREPVVIYKKAADAEGAGTRLEFASGRNTAIRISPEEIVRVARGEALDLYYQGGKLAAQTLANGSWMRFDPVAPAPGDEAKAGNSRRVIAPTPARDGAAASTPSVNPDGNVESR